MLRALFCKARPRWPKLTLEILKLIMNTSSFTRPFFYCYFLISATVMLAGQVMMPMRPHSLELKPSLNRILDLNIDNGGEIPRSAANLESLERTLSALQPTLIMGFPCLTKGAPLSMSQVTLFLEIQKKVLAANPHCKFSVTLHASDFLTTPELLAKLQEITTKLKPDIINMVLSSNNDLVSPTALARAIDSAHAHGQMVIYEGPSNMIPDGVDGFVMKTSNGEIHRDEVNGFKIRHRLPVVVKPSFVARNQDQKEMNLLSHLAEEQGPFGYHLAYPLQLAASANLNQNKDAASLVMMRALMTRYN